MRRKFPRFLQGNGNAVDVGEAPIDVFEQTEKSLLGEALSRPLGIGAALAILSATALFAANHFMFGWKRIDDYALVAFFVAGGVLLSIVLRSGDPKVTPRKRSVAKRDEEEVQELLLDKVAATPQPEALAPRSVGLADPASARAPIPPGASVNPLAAEIGAEGSDDEVSGYQRALVHYVDQGDLHGQGEVLRRLGHLAKARGHLKESREFYVNSRNCFRKIDDHYAEAAVLLDIGQVLESLGEQDAAGAAYRDANRALLDVAMNTGDRYSSMQAHAAD